MTAKPYKLVVPLAGRGQRMIDGGYSQPKPLIFAGDRRIIEWSMQSIDYSECDVTFVVREEHAVNHQLDAFLLARYPGCQVVLSRNNTEGAIESAPLGLEGADDGQPLIVYCPDVAFDPVFQPSPDHFSFAGTILTFKANSPNYSYVAADDHGMVHRVAEKLVISEWASVGVYCFQTTGLFRHLAAASREGWEYRERFIAPLYNWITPRVWHEPVKAVHVMGTPAELQFFEERVFRYTTWPRKFAICSDHSGFAEKERFKEDFIPERDIVDCGCFSERDCDYAGPVKDAVRFVHERGYFGIGFCRSGQGVNLCAAANGAHSVLVRDIEDVTLGIRHNAANFFAIAAGKHTLDFGELVNVLQNEQFEGGRHQNRLMSV